MGSAALVEVYALQSGILIEGLHDRTKYVPGKYEKFEKITRKASDVAEDVQLYRVIRVVRLFCPRSSFKMHLMLFSERLPIYASCMTISCGRTEQHVILGFAELVQLIRIRRHSLSILTE